MNFYSENDITRVLKLSFKMVPIDALVDLIAVRMCDMFLEFCNSLLCCNMRYPRYLFVSHQQ